MLIPEECSCLRITNSKIRTIDLTIKQEGFFISKWYFVFIKKGLKKGTYKLRIKVTAAGNSKYKPATKTVTVKLKIK